MEEDKVDKAILPIALACNGMLIFASKSRFGQKSQRRRVSRPAKTYGGLEILRFSTKSEIRENLVKATEGIRGQEKAEDGDNT